MIIFISFNLAFLRIIRHIVTIYQQIGTFCLEVVMKESSIEIFRKYNGQLRMSEALRLGINRYTLYSLRDKGIVEQVSRGVYRMVDLPPISNPDLVVVSLRFPKAVICLVSALAYYEITTQVPHVINVAVPRDSRMPSLDSPPVQAYKFSYDAYKAGIEKHQIDDIIVRIYSPEKTIVDCFKYRNKIGMDVVLEALKLYRKQKKFKLEELLKYAKICRVGNVMKPYLEATV